MGSLCDIRANPSRDAFVCRLIITDVTELPQVGLSQINDVIELTATHGIEMLDKSATMLRVS